MGANWLDMMQRRRMLPTTAPIPDMLPGPVAPDVQGMPLDAQFGEPAATYAPPAPSSLGPALSAEDAEFEQSMQAAKRRWDAAAGAFGLMGSGATPESNVPPDEMPRELPQWAQGLIAGADAIGRITADEDTQVGPGSIPYFQQLEQHRMERNKRLAEQRAREDEIRQSGEKFRNALAPSLISAVMRQDKPDDIERIRQKRKELEADPYFQALPPEEKSAAALEAIFGVKRSKKDKEDISFEEELRRAELMSGAHAKGTAKYRTPKEDELPFDEQVRRAEALARARAKGSFGALFPDSEPTRPAAPGQAPGVGGMGFSPAPGSDGFSELMGAVAAYRARIAAGQDPRMLRQKFIQQLGVDPDKFEERP